MIDVREGLRRAAAWNSDRVAIMQGDIKLTFAEAWDRGLRFANALLDLGLKPGDCVAALEENSLEAADFYLGTAAANIIRVPLYKKNSLQAHAHMVRHTRCKALVVSESLAHEVSGIGDLAPALKHVIVRDAGYESWLLSKSSSDPNPPINLDDCYTIRHSGGTTGVPKGMAFTHRMWMNIERDWTYRLPPIEIGDACLHVAPISHASGYLFLPTWMSGGYNIFQNKFDASVVLDLLSKHGGYCFVVPTILGDLVAEAGDTQRSFARIKAIAVAGAPIRPQTALAARALFGDCLHQLYGQTEAVPLTWMTPREWFDDTPGSQSLLSVGRVMPFAGVEIRDENNGPLPAGEVGEVAVHCDGQIAGFWNDSDLSKKRIVDGWVLTGDMGRLDRNGYLYLVDRKDDMIISGGQNIWPAELEIAISSLAGVREVAVVGAPHPRWGETPVAIVVPNDDADLDEGQIIAVCVEHLGSLKKPSKVIIQRDLLPRTPVGKINRKYFRGRV